MLDVVNENNIIFTIINKDTPTQPNERLHYPWLWVGDTWTDQKPLDYAKTEKTKSLTSSRDAEEYHNVTTDIGVFEFDTLSQTRLTNAMNSMNDMQTREWTTADHTIVTMYKSDFKAIFSTAAERSDENFAKLNNLKQLVNNATSVAEVEAIHWPERT